MDENSLSESGKEWFHMIHDVYMINWDEPKFDQNHAQASRVLDTNINVVSGVKGIHAAHLHCASQSSSDFFWCIDGDSWMYDSARSDMIITETGATDLNSVYVMRAKNPFNGLVYGHGAIKLFPRFAFIANINSSTVDMTSGASLHYRIIHRLVSEHRYNASPFHTWRTAFRECVKLSSSIIPNSNQNETLQRLDAWCSHAPPQNIPFWKENINGANLGKKYGETYKNDKDNLLKINDFSWLRQEFEHHEREQ